MNISEICNAVYSGVISSFLMKSEVFSGSSGQNTYPKVLNFNHTSVRI